MSETFHGFKVVRGEAFYVGRNEIMPLYLAGRRKSDGAWDQLSVHGPLDDNQPDVRRFINEVAPVDQDMILEAV